MTFSALIYDAVPCWATLTDLSLHGTAAYRTGPEDIKNNEAHRAVFFEISVIFMASPHKKDRAVLRLFSSIMDAIDDRRRGEMRIPLLPLMPKLR